MTIDRPDISWRDGKTPEATRFGDIYFSPDDGVAETTHVFLQGIGAPEIWAGCQTFVIGETGFGTGLNFLCAWDLFERTSASSGSFHFVSVEGFPLDRADLEQALSAFPQFEEKAKQLIAAWPPKQAGVHRRTFVSGRVVLTLLFGEAEAVLTDSEIKADAWFLDGFAPSKNPELWSEAVLGHVARLSKPGARVATFTVAGAVRRGLQAAGFEVEKRPGFGRKRDCLAGKLVCRASEQCEPWFARAAMGVRPRRVAIVGAGIAGASLAYALRAQSMDIHVFERNTSFALEGSGNPAAMMNPRVSLGKNADADFRVLAYSHAVKFYDDLAASGARPWEDRCGALQLAQKNKTAEHQQRLVNEGGMPEGWLRPVNAEEASELAGVRLDAGGLYVEHGGFLSPHRLCEALLEDATVHFEENLMALTRYEDGWWLHFGDGECFQADAVVLANAMGVTSFAQTGHFPFGPNRGQLTIVEPNDQTRGVNLALSYNGYLSPVVTIDGKPRQLIGATFDRPDSFDLSAPHVVREEDHERNLTALESALGDLGLAREGLEGRAAVRCTTPDRLPVVGAAPVAESVERAYREVHHGRNEAWVPLPTHEGLYVFAGFGSRGFQYAPLAAEVLASEMLGMPLPVSKSVAEGLHPARFLMRALKRRG